MGQGITPELDAALTNAHADLAQFFSNAVNTRTHGLDVVANYSTPFARGSFSANAAVNFNQNTIRKINTPAGFETLEQDENLGNNYIDQRQLSLLQTGNPKSKFNLNLGYELEKWSVGIATVY